MSPEQLTNPREVDSRSDIWSLGVILFELLAGQSAFQAQTLPLLMTAIMQQQPDNLGRLRPEVPPGLCAVVSRCLEKSPSLRFQTVSELVTALLPFAPRRSHWNIERIAKSGHPPSLKGRTLQTHRESPSTSPPAPSGQAQTPKEGTRGEWSRESDPAPRSRSAWLVPVAAGGAVAVLAALAWFFFGRPNETGIAAEASKAQDAVNLQQVPSGSPAGASIVEGAAGGVGSASVAATPSSPPVQTAAEAVVDAVQQPATVSGGPQKIPTEAVAAHRPTTPHVVPAPTAARPTPEVPHHAESPARNPLQMDIK